MWFDNDFPKLNADRYKLLVTKHEDEVSTTLDKEVMKGNKTVTLLGIKIDNKLDFNEHIPNIYKKASLKLHALASIRKIKNSNENLYRRSIQLLSVNLDVPQQDIK